VASTPPIPPPPSADWGSWPPPPPAQPLLAAQSSTQPGVLIAAAIILLVFGGLEGLGGLGSLLHGRGDAASLFVLALGCVSVGGGVGLLQSRRAGGVLGIVGGGLQLLFSLPLIAFVPIIGVVASAGNAFVLWAVATNERRLRSSAYPMSVDPWTSQPTFSSSAQPRFGSKPWHKASLVVLIIFGGLLASLIVYAMVVGPTGS
jgi:hypothetical protein